VFLEHLPFLPSLFSEVRAHGLEKTLLQLMLDYSSMLSSFTPCTLFGGMYLWQVALLTSTDNWGYFCTLLCLKVEEIG
jgi:hypothetical protein